ncbi:MAG: hypothetical protein JXB85_08660 [Anaerolineales bacterium]|nr:hypothetical protein [Anaerolineales bacterium]
MSKPIPVDVLKKAITYHYLLSYSPAEQIDTFKKSTAALRKGLAEKAGMQEAAFFKAVIPEVAQRIAAFHHDSREPDPQWVEALVETAGPAGQAPEKAAAFQAVMSKVARLKPRALPENRLHRKKGCAFCRLPCYYGYFSLVSEPDFRILQRLLEAEAGLPKERQNPLRPVMAFTFSHLVQTTQAERGVIQRVHLGNLAYCLLLLSMAKSRLALPEAELQAFQANAQAWIMAS